MRDLWTQLRACWALEGANQDDQRMLLSRQLRNLFRVVPLYAFSNVVTLAGLMLVIWPNLPKGPALAWGLGAVLAHGGWGLHALWLARRGRKAPASLTFGHLYQATLWCAVAATACSAGLYLAGPYAIDDGTKILLASYVAGLIATGVLVGITTPLVSMFWLVILTVGACLMVARLDFRVQWVILTLLFYYAVLLTTWLLFASRMFVARVEAEIAAERDHQTLGLVLGDFEENANDWLWESDSDGVLTRAGARLGQALGLGEADVIGARLASLFLAGRVLSVTTDREVGVAALRGRLAQRAPFNNVVVEALVEGSPRSWRISAKPLLSPEGSLLGWRGVGSEVSDARAREADSILRERHLHHLATHDMLTELPNRRAFLERVREAASGGTHAVAMIDLDNFKAINDGLGHSTGDAILKMVAQRLTEALSPGDLLVRLGGDEFAVLLVGLPESAPEAELEARLERVLQHLRPPEVVKSFRVDVRASIGATLVDVMPEEPYELMRRADIALYAAKDSGRDTWRIYEASMSDKLRNRLSMVSDLSVAVERGQFKLAYQCLVDLADFRIVGCEALLRWNHPTHGLVSPVDFIPVAEESGLIVPIGLWVLEQACRDATRWPAHMRVAVNVSAIQLESPSIVENLVQAVERSGLDPARLVLEITESSLARDHPAARGVLHRLRERGIRLAIDDFGTGYSSMAQLRELPFDQLKLDQSFVAGISGQQGEASRSIIASLLHLSGSMQLTVTAEGVENMTQLHALRALGCHYGQGYLFARPLPEPQLAPLLQAGYLAQGS